MGEAAVEWSGLASASREGEQESKLERPPAPWPRETQLPAGRALSHVACTFHGPVAYNPPAVPAGTGAAIDANAHHRQITLGFRADRAVELGPATHFVP